MNRIVKHHYPASRLPEELRKGLPAGSHVTVTVDEEVAGSPMTRAELLRLVETSRDQHEGITLEEAVERTRSVREEWDS